MKSMSQSKRGLIAALGGVLLLASVAVAVTTATAAPIISGPLPSATAQQLINRVNGGATGLNVPVDIGTTPPTVFFPSSPGDTIDVTLTGVYKSEDGVTQSALTSVEAAKVQASWCGNFVAADPAATPPTAARAVLGSDVSGAPGSYCKGPFSTAMTVTPSESVPGSGNFDKIRVQGALTGLPAGVSCTTSGAAGTPLAVPCLLLVSDAANGGSALTVALPIANITTLVAAGPIDLVKLAASALDPRVDRCISAAPAASVGCSSGRATPAGALLPIPTAAPKPIALGGAGFAPTANNLNPTALAAAYTALGTCAAGDPTLVACGAEIAAVAAFAGRNAGGIAAGQL